MHYDVEQDVVLFESIRNDLSNRLSDLRGISDEELYEMIDELIASKEKEYRLSLRPKLKLRNSLFDSFRRLDILQELLDDKDITEIMVNGKEDIFIEKKGRSIRLNKRFKSNEQLEDMIQQIVSEVNRVVNVSSPIADARLKDGSRVHIVLPPVSLVGPIITIRKFPEVISMERLILLEAINKEASDFLKKLVRAGYNIFISGGTNSGKTTFLNALSAYIPDDERVITIEDSAELQLKHIKNIVRLEAKPANIQGEKAVSIADLIKASLRMNPSRIVVGEVRGAEALDMLQAMNTGHDGSLSTGHGNSPKDMLSRLETMVLSAADLPLAAIRSQISSAVDIMIHLGRLRDKSRKVLSIAEVGDCINGEIKLNRLYEFREQKESRMDKVVGELKKLSELENKTKLKLAGERL
ncbi:MAG: CpaF family protein [Lachnospiraceae bacterium]|jgi:type II secretion system protein E|nr:MAG: CpaF family protein [Lachnospiraceae bacterium]